jgi:hypothetical protein
METCWNVTIKDISPLFNYFPYADGDTQGWTAVFREGNRVVNEVTVGIGDSQHVTAGQALAQIVFNGESQPCNTPKQLNQFFPKAPQSISMVQLWETCNIRSSLMARSLLANPTARSWRRSPICRASESTPCYYDPSPRLQGIGWHCSPPLLLLALA